MQEKMLVSKNGDIYRVAIDVTSSRPMPIASYDDEPPGAFMYTYNSLQELKAAWPGRDFAFLSPPPVQERTVEPLSLELSDKVRAIMSKNNLTPKPSTGRVEAVAVAMGQTLPSLDRNADVRLLHVQEFLKRLETAREYASKKNQATLELKIAVVRELLSEVFGVQ